MYHISVIGAGCVGSVIIDRVISRQDIALISVIAEGYHGNRIKENGITVNGINHRVVNVTNVTQNVDLVIVCVKNYDLEDACKDIEKYIDPNTIILPLLNSISPTPFIKNCFPDNRVLFGYISKIDSKFENGSFLYNIAGDIHFGYSKNTQISPELLQIKQIFEESGFKAFIDSDMQRGIWKKWMLNVGANQVSALTEANYIQFSNIPEIKSILMLAMQELLNIACYEKVDLGTNDILELIEYLTTYPYPKQTSMLQDILAHRKTEIDYISGDIIKLSKKWNCPCPVNLAMYYLIKSKEKAYLL